MPGGTGMTGVVHQFLSRLASDVDALEADPTADALGENAADLIATLIQSQFGMPWGVNDPDAVLREQVRSFITRNHSDVALAPAEIASAHGVSLRRLHQLFEGTGTTVMDLVRTERLAAVHRDLADPRLLDRSIAQLATAHGHTSPTVFARQFRAVYDTSPREFRTAALSAPRA